CFAIVQNLAPRDSLRTGLSCGRKHLLTVIATRKLGARWVADAVCDEREDINQVSDLVPQAEKPNQVSPQDLAGSPGIGERIDSFLRRRFLMILVCLVAALPLGAIYLVTSPTVYTASATMMIETRKGPLQQSLLGEASPDAVWIESQIGIIRSQGVASYVVKQ